MRDKINWAHLRKYSNKYFYYYCDKVAILSYKLVISNMPAFHDNFTVMIFMTVNVMHKGNI